MIGPFPHPMPDETLHSLLVRHYNSSVYLKWRAMAKESFGRQWVYSTMSVPVGMRYCFEQMALDGFSAEQCIQEHTYLPYYTALLPEEQRKRFQHLAMDIRTKEEMICLGRLMHQNRTAARLRFCPECMLEDIQRYGFSYWRRLFQLPGVFVCERHRHLLLESSIDCRDFGAANFGNTEVNHIFPAEPAAKLNHREQVLALRIAEGQRICLQESARINRTLASDWNGVSVYMKRLLHRKGMASPSGHVNTEEYRSAMLQYYGQALLWVTAEYHRWRRCPNALKMVLIGIFLSGSFENFLFEIDQQKRSDI